MKSALRSLLLSSIFAFAMSAKVFSQTGEERTVSEDKLVGNVYGTVVDKTTNEPIRGADVFLLDWPIRTTSGETVVHTERGDVTIPDLQSAVRSGTSNDSGEFLVNFVPTPYPSKLYTIVAKATGYGLFIIDGARVLPGAVMALKVACRLTKDANVATFFSGTDLAAPMIYRDEEVTRSALLLKSGPSSPQAAEGVAYTVFATREGLVGQTTANGHVIVTRDHFVALPSTRALDANGQNTPFQVKLTYGSRTIVAPVWDIGPWNTRDDYWNPSGIRQMWQDLAQGMPESQAAYQTGYNGGHDQYGRQVLNPAGIDLADGTFWDDLALPDNSWIQVEYLWRPGVKVGDFVQAAGAVNVGTSPGDGGPSVGQEPDKNAGNIVDGPQGASYQGVFYVWWKVQWNDGLLGWSMENHLRAGTVFVGQGSSKPPSSYELLQNYPNPFNPTTSISYQLPANSFATLRVSDVLGREVAILVNGQEAPGSYSVQWDGSNSPSGVYFFRLEARRTDDGRDGVFVATKKMVLVK